jgi:hypothetical protein
MRMETEILDHFEQKVELAAEIGDLDRTRNLKIRTFAGLVLTPVFRDLQPRLNYAAMGRHGVTPMQYYDDFENHLSPFGYGDRFDGRYEIRLCRSVSDERHGSSGGVPRVERLILETRATILGRVAVGPPLALGYEPELGASAVAGRGRVLHVLTRPQSPPGQRAVSEVPREIGFLALQPFDGPYPTIPLLVTLEDGFAMIATVHHRGIWGVANSDVYQHINAREYIAMMENGITAALCQAGIPLESYAALRARIIFRRPSFVGQAYVLGVRLYRRGDDIAALGVFQPDGQDHLANPSRAAVFLRFDGALA